MKKILVAALIFLFAIGFAAGNGSHEGEIHLDVDSGWVTPDSALYGLETAWDNAAMGLGLAHRGTVAQERASEAREMAAKNNTEAMQRAVDQLNDIAAAASEGDAEGLQKAANVLQEVMERAPSEAQQGLQTALNNIQQAQDRIPGDVPAGLGRPDQDGQNASALVEEARTKMERGRQDLRDGNTAMDNDNMQTAKNEFGQAEQRFTEAINLIEDLDTAEADDLLSRLRTARQTARDARSSVEQQMGGNQTGGQP